jgi:hypothetical protein
MHRGLEQCENNVAKGTLQHDLFNLVVDLVERGFKKQILETKEFKINVRLRLQTTLWT